MKLFLKPNTLLSSLFVFATLAIFAPTPGHARNRLVCSASCANGSCWCVLCSCGCTNGDPWCGEKEATVAHATLNTVTAIKPLDGDIGDIDLSTVAVAREASHGKVTAVDEGAFLYTPDAEFTGLDSFTFRVCNTSGICDLGTVLIDVVPEQ